MKGRSEMVLDKAELKNSILRKLRRQYGKTMEEAHEYEIYYAVSRATLDYVVEKWYNTKKTYACKTDILFFSRIFNGTLFRKQSYQPADE